MSVDGKLLKGNIKVKKFQAKLIGKANKEGRPGWLWMAESKLIEQDCCSNLIGQEPRGQSQAEQSEVPSSTSTRGTGCQHLNPCQG